MKNISKTRRTIVMVCLLCYSVVSMIAQTGTESVTVTYDFSPRTAAAYGMKFAEDQNEYIQDTDIKNQDVTLSLLTPICYYKATSNSYLRIQGNGNIGQLRVRVPDDCYITKVTFTAASNSNNNEVNLENNITSTKLNCKKGESCSFNRYNETTRDITFTQVKTYNSYITKIDVTYTRNKPDVAFEEKSAATKQAIADNIGKTSATINRAFNNNYMNTLCLPFDITCGKLREVFGEGTIIYRYADSSNGDIYLSSSSTADVPAGTPIIIKPGIYVDSPVFTGISLSDKEPKEVQHGDISLCGTYAPYEMNTDGSEVFLNTSQKFTKPKAGQNTMRGFRCFFRKTDNGVKDLSAIFDDKQTDGINSMQHYNSKENSKIYSIYGSESEMPRQLLAPGIYIMDGKKILIEK